MRGQGRRAKASHHGRRGEHRHLERERPHDEVAAEHQLLADDPSVRAPVPLMFAVELTQEARGDDPHAQHGRRRGAENAPEVHEDGHGDGTRNEPGQGKQQGLAGILDAAHPAVAGHLYEGERDGERRDAQPLGGQARDVLGARHEPGDAPCEDPHEGHEGGSHAQGHPGGLDAFSDGGLAVATAVEAGGARRGAIGQESQLGGDNRLHGRSGPQGRERRGTQASHDSGVEEQVQRHRGQHAQGGQG